jgi:hypothetical protein
MRATHPTLMTFAPQTTDMKAACVAAEHAGLRVARRGAMSRARARMECG